VFKIQGEAIFGVSRFPEKVKFTKYVRALSEKHAIEKVYSDLGGNNKIKRNNIKIISIEEVDINKLQQKFIRDLSKLERWIN